jgi:hypothetical protein
MEKGAFAVAADQHDRRGGATVVNPADALGVYTRFLESADEEIAEGVIAQAAREGGLSAEAAEDGGGDTRQPSHRHFEGGNQAEGSTRGKLVYGLCFYIGAHTTDGNKIKRHAMRPLLENGLVCSAWSIASWE